MTKRDGRFRRLARTYQRRWDRVKLELKRRVTGFDPLLLRAYRSHGGNGRLRVIGRLIEDKGVRERKDGAHVLWNLTNTVRRFESDEIPGATVEARLGGARVRGETDHEGFFDLSLKTPGGPDPGWHEVEVEVLESLAGGAGTSTVANVLVPSDGAEFGVISDIDDTVLETRASDALTRFRLVMFRSARERSPMPGSSHLYRQLEGGADGRASNPFFYVSKSGWGLYDLIDEFLRHHELPVGPLYLQDLAIIEPKSPHLGSRHHKRDTIAELFEDCPRLPFVLIGDSGQGDPETYRDLVDRHGDHVRAVLIRSVTGPERDSEVRHIVQEIVDMGVPAAAAESSISLARAAADFGLIPGDAIADVREGMLKAERREAGGGP